MTAVQKLFIDFNSSLTEWRALALEKSVKQLSSTGTLDKILQASTTVENWCSDPQFDAHVPELVVIPELLRQSAESRSERIIQNNLLRVASIIQGIMFYSFDSIATPVQGESALESKRSPPPAQAQPKWTPLPRTVIPETLAPPTESTTLDADLRLPLNQDPLIYNKLEAIFNIWKAQICDCLNSAPIQWASVFHQWINAGNQICKYLAEPLTSGDDLKGPLVGALREVLSDVLKSENRTILCPQIQMVLKTCNLALEGFSKMPFPPSVELVSDLKLKTLIECTKQVL